MLAEGERYPHGVQADAELMLLFAGLHLIGLVVVATLLVMFLRSETVRPWSPPDQGGDGGDGNDRTPPHAPPGPDGGGLPLPDAGPARYRLRDHDRPSQPARSRRRAREPERAPVSSSPRARSGR
jgi:hypothetical protein